MCFMALGGILSAVGSIVGAVVSAAGAQQQADAQAKQAEYQAAVARNNATAEAYKGTEKAQATAEKGDYALSKQRVAYAAAGANIQTGTPVTVFGESSEKVYGDVANEQYGGKIEAQRWQDQATLHEMEASQARKAGQVGVASALVGGISGVGKMFSGGGSGQQLTAFG